MSEINLTTVCMNAMEKMTDKELCWVIRNGTIELHNRLYYLKQEMIQ